VLEALVEKIGRAMIDSSRLIQGDGIFTGYIGWFFGSVRSES
jgi:hypothetical protein